MSKETEMYEWLIDNEIVTEEALSLATYLCGLNMETLNRVLYIQTGYRDREQYESGEIYEGE